MKAHSCMNLTDFQPGSLSGRCRAVLVLALACAMDFVVHGQVAASSIPAAPQSQITPASPAEVPSPSRAGFSITQGPEGNWLVSPSGERFFSLGVCCVNQGASPEQFDPENPGYAAWQNYLDATQWAEVALGRLRSWGFTTVGAWSDYATLKSSRETNVVFIPVLHMAATAGAPWWDMWDAKITNRMDQVARDQILALRDDPRVIGYYTDNEMGWWNATLFKMTLEQPSTSGQRQRLIALLRDTYANDWSRLSRDFEPESVGTWEELNQGGMLYLRPGGQGIRTMRRFLGLLAERYYALAQNIIRKHHPGALVFGDRYQSFYYPEVARAAAPFVDAISSNLNTPWNDGTPARFYLETLHQLTSKPILVGEFYMAARENRSGNQNNRGVFPVVDSQKERAAGFRNTLEELCRTPYVIGADWFQYYDEPRHGRGDGENYNFGLVDIEDRPYRELVGAAAALNPKELKLAPRTPRPDASTGVPKAPADPFAFFEPRTALGHWNREQGFVRAASEFPLADLYICWDKEAIYLGLYSQDILEDAFYRSKVVPKGDRAEWSVLPGSADRPIRARIGGGMEAIVSDRSFRVANISGLNLNVRNIAAMRLPAQAFGKRRFRNGDSIKIASTLLTHCQGYRMEWRGEFTLLNQR